MDTVFGMDSPRLSNLERAINNLSNRINSIESGEVFNINNVNIDSVADVDSFIKELRKRSFSFS